MSQKKKVYLADSAPEEHTIVFYRGKLVEQYFSQNSGSHLSDGAIVTQLFVMGTGFFQAVPLG
jgi:hypothetical protein